MVDQLSTLNYYQPDTLGVALQLPANLPLSAEARICFQQGMAKLQMAEPADAVELLTRTVELAPYFSEARICLGLAYALTYNIYPAIDQLEVAGKIDPENFCRALHAGQAQLQVANPAKRV